VVNEKCRLIRAKGDDRFECFMQNKPNSHGVQMNANPFLTKDYENESTVGGQENKANQTQFPWGQRSER